MVGHWASISIMEHYKFHFVCVVVSGRLPTRWPKMLACLSYAEKIIECFDFETGRWILLTERPGSSSFYGSEAISANGSKFFALGGVQSRYKSLIYSSFYHVYHFPKATSIWSQVFKTCYQMLQNLSIIYLQPNGQIYVVLWLRAYGTVHKWLRRPSL